MEILSRVRFGERLLYSAHKKPIRYYLIINGVGARRVNMMDIL